MGLQASALVMVGLGVRADQPVLDLQPRLVDGIHLRWAFERSRGFPWYGYFLFRRPHEFRGERCLADDLSARAAGASLGMAYSAGWGTLSSDRPLVLSEDFPQPGRMEIDLRGHDAVRLELPPDRPAFRVRVQIGFRDAGEGLRCIDFGRFLPTLHASPLKVGGVVFAARDPRGEPLRQLRLVSLPADRGAVALTVDGMVEIDLPEPTRQTEFGMVAEARKLRVEAIDKAGRVVGKASPEPGTRRVQTVALGTRTAFARLRVSVVSGTAAIARLCWQPPRARAVTIPISAFDGEMEVAAATLSGAPGQTANATLSFDRITSVEIGGGLAALVDLCAQIVPEVALKDWRPVPQCPQPMLLPLTHLDYPLRSAPTDPAGAETTALGRISYGQPDLWAGAGFTSLHEQLVALVDGGPPGRGGREMASSARAQRNVAATGAAPGAQSPRVPSLHPLDMVLLGVLQPAIAQMVGLYWADRTVNERASYDYLIVADHDNVANGKAQPLLDHIERYGWDDVDAWITFDRRMAPAPPPAPPSGVRAYALPGGTYRRHGSMELREAYGNVGLTWPQPVDPIGYLKPGEPIFYHVWRDDQGNAANPQPSPYADTLVTRGGPVLASRPAAAPSNPTAYPSDWPQFSMATHDFGLGKGWYGYQINSIDIFGRFSDRSPFAEWRQWTPAPVPRPWYYIDPPADRIVHPSSVRILHRSPPPPPAFVEAWVLDPADTVAVTTASAMAWRQSLPPGLRDSLIGLRVRWRWSVAQQRQAPDATEFRIYWNPGTEPPAGGDSVANWQIRCHVATYPANVAVNPNGDRTYEIILPQSPGQGAFPGGVPLAPTRADPIAYANVTVTAADSDQHAPDAWPGGGALGGRPGNESRTASPSRVYRVLREPPPPPEPVVDSDRVYASPADWHSRSYYTFRWRPQPNLFTHVFRALDESVFSADWARRPRAALQPGDAQHFPDPVAESTWTAAKRQLVCDALNALNQIPKTAAGRTQAFAVYRALSDDALRVLANQPGCDGAFVQLTLIALDPDATETRDRRGPDDPAGYAPRAALRTYIDTLDGRAANRYLYRAVYVDGAQNRSSKGPVGTPVRLPDVVPPRAPSIIRLTAGDRVITVTWASNREPDLMEYRVYRAESAEAGRDLRMMAHVATLAAPADPAARPAEVSWDDTTVIGRRPYWYRVVALDRPDPVDLRGGGGNLSEPSPARAGRAFDTRVPTLTTNQLSTAWDEAAGGVRLTWPSAEADLICRVQRRPSWTGGPLRLMAHDLAGGRYHLLDDQADEFETYRYQLTVATDSGQEASQKVRGHYEPE